jgi:hypothetical protein
LTRCGVSCHFGKLAEAINRRVNFTETYVDHANPQIILAPCLSTKMVSDSMNAFCTANKQHLGVEAYAGTFSLLRTGLCLCGTSILTFRRFPMGFRLGIALPVRRIAVWLSATVLPSRLLQISAGLIVTIIAAARLCKPLTNDQTENLSHYPVRAYSLLFQFPYH